MPSTEAPDPAAVALQYYPLAKRLASSPRFDPEDYDDLVQKSMLELMQSVVKYNTEEKAIDALGPWAYNVILRSMQDMYLYKRSASCIGRGHVELKETSSVFDGEEEFYEQVFVDEFRNEVARLFGTVALQVLDHLVSPSGEAVSLALAEQSLKAEQKKKGVAVRSVDTLRVTHEHIRRAVGLKSHEWHHTVRQLRQLAKVWFAASPRALALTH